VNPVVLAPSRLGRVSEVQGCWLLKHDLEQIAGVLGWEGKVIDGVRLVDTELAAVTNGPELNGLLVPVRGSWRRALSVARTCLALAPTALLPAGPDAPSELCLLECGYAEVGLVIAGPDGATLALPARVKRPAGRRAVDQALVGQLTAQLAR
jgi:hypothetical protein